jgi:tetratricopeptide (TPR) repeat protein
LKNFDEALGFYFKANYLEPDNQKVWRAVAWCLFLTGKYGQARKYYKKIIENRPQTHDFLNAGHTEWAQKHLKKAIEYYKKAIEAETGDYEKFLELFRQDISCLENVGVKSSEIPLMLDYLRYNQP